MDYKEILEVAMPALIGVLAVGLGYALKKLRDVVKNSDNKIDDAVLAAVEKAVESTKKPE